MKMFFPDLKMTCLCVHVYLAKVIGISVKNNLISKKNELSLSVYFRASVL